MIKYLIVVNGEIKHFFYLHEKDVLISAYFTYRKFYSDVSCYEISFDPDTEKFYTKKMTIEKKGKDRVDVYSDSGE